MTFCLPENWLSLKRSFESSFNYIFLQSNFFLLMNWMFWWNKQSKLVHLFQKITCLHKQLTLNGFQFTLVLWWALPAPRPGMTRSRLSKTSADKKIWKIPYENLMAFVQNFLMAFVQILYKNHPNLGNFCSNLGEIHMNLVIPKFLF